MPVRLAGRRPEPRLVACGDGVAFALLPAVAVAEGGGLCVPGRFRLAPCCWGRVADAEAADEDDDDAVACVCALSALCAAGCLLPPALTTPAVTPPPTTTSAAAIPAMTSDRRHPGPGGHTTA